MFLNGRCRTATPASTFTKLMLASAIGFGAETMTPAARAQVGAAESAVVMVYQRFGEDDNPGNSVRLSEFDAHLAELANGKYNVVPLPDLLDAIGEGRPLPNRTVAITIDDAFRSVYDRAWPRLKKAGIPFTLFVSTDPLDMGSTAYMTWDEIRELRDTGVTVGAHTASHMLVSQATIDELRVDIERSLLSFERELGERPAVFSWPQGEMSVEATGMLREMGFRAAFGYHSGTVSRMSDEMMLPRFPMVGSYASLEEFTLRANTLALPLTAVVPSDPMVRGGVPDAFTFRIHPAVGRVRGFHCFHSEQGQLELTETDERSFSARLDAAALKGTWRINCTMPTGGKRFRWWGMQYHSVE